jgi:uncharacterized membrane protein YfcA
MNKEVLVKICFFGGLILTFIGSILKILHVEYLESILILGVILSVIYILLSLIEVAKSNRINNNEKLMWIVCFIFLNGLTGILYYFMGRKRIV